MKGVAKIWGLVLLGGQSHRMGYDKAGIRYRSVPQWELCRRLLEPRCEQVYFSCRLSQKHAFSLGESALIDSVDNRGPAAGMWEAFRFNREVAWFILAVDLPYCEKTHITLLAERRNPRKQATLFRHPLRAFVEPFLAIWEPSLQKIFRSRWKQGDSLSPSALIREASCEWVSPPSNNDALLSANTPRDRQSAKKSVKLFPGTCKPTGQMPRRNI